MQIIHFTFPALTFFQSRNSPKQIFDWTAAIWGSSSTPVRFPVFAVWPREWDCGHLFFPLSSQGLTACRVLPFLADDLPVEEALSQVKMDFSSAAGHSQCYLTSCEKFSQMLNMNISCVCSEVNQLIGSQQAVCSFYMSLLLLWLDGRNDNCCVTFLLSDFWMAAITF